MTFRHIAMVISEVAIVTTLGCTGAPQSTVQKDSDSIWNPTATGHRNTVGLRTAIETDQGVLEYGFAGVMLGSDHRVILTAAHTAAGLERALGKPRLAIDAYRPITAKGETFVVIESNDYGVVYHPSLTEAAIQELISDVAEPVSMYPHMLDLAVIVLKLTPHELERSEALAFDFDTVLMADHTETGEYVVDGSMIDGAMAMGASGQVQQAPSVKVMFNAITDYGDMMSVEMRNSMDAPTYSEFVLQEGDSGGPIYRLDANRGMVLHGLVSGPVWFARDRENASYPESLVRFYPGFVQFMQGQLGNSTTFLARRGTRIDRGVSWGGISIAEWVLAVDAHCISQDASGACNNRVLCDASSNTEYNWLPNGVCAPTCGQLGSQVGYIELGINSPSSRGGNSTYISRAASMKGSRCCSMSAWLNVTTVSGGTPCTS